MSELNATVARVTERIVERSRDTRGRYLELMKREGDLHADRNTALPCSNLAHGFAAMGEDKDSIANERGPNIGIISAYNDTISSHQPFGAYPPLMKVWAREAGATAQVAGCTPAMCDGVTQGMDGMELARRIRAEVSSQVQLVLLTSAADLSAEEARKAGIAVTLPKPVRSQWLHGTLVRLLSTGTPPPVPAWSGPPRVPSLNPPPAKAAPASRGRVLVAEDNKVNQMVAVGILEKLGYRADVAANGHEVLTAMERRSDYVAVLMDCQMPEMDGFEATLALREHEGAGRRTPVIAMTAAAMDEDRDLAMSVGMDDFVVKPVTAADLEGALARWALAPPAEEVTSSGAGDADDSAPIDASRLAELRVLGGPDGALMKRLFNKFGTRGGDLVDTMRQAVAQEDAVVVGLSKIPRLVEVFARRLQTQENLTAQIIDAINENLNPRGAAVMLEAEHMCMTMRGVRAHDVNTITHRFTGVFAEDREERDRFFAFVGKR